MIEPRHAEDPRILRPHPDSLPRWRRCPTCPKEQDVHELTAHNFYEDTSRYPWQMSRFSKHCRACTSNRNNLTNKAARAQRSSRQRAWRAISSQNRVQASVFYTDAQRSIDANRQQTRLSSRVAKARLKREMLRLYGPRDGIRALIAERSRMFAARRLQGATERALSAFEAQCRQESPQILQASEAYQRERQNPEQAMAELQRLREQHRCEQETRNA